MKPFFENKPSNPMVVSYLTLRRLIGILGIALPALLVIGTFALGHCHHIQNSISHYYYTLMGDVYVGTLCAVAVFLLSYRGYDRPDDIATNLAGIFALGSALFATSQNPDVQCSIRFLPDNNLRITIHYIASALFFITLSFISIFLFTKSSGHKSKRKLCRNKVYIACGIIMLISIVFIFLFKIIPWFETHWAKYKPVFWLEWTALLAFGTSWLVKGKFMVKRK